MIGREDFRAYSDAVAAIADEAARAVEERVLAWLGGNPGATVAQAREAAKAIMAEVAPAYDEAAASLAAEWYDEQAEAAHAKLPSAVTETTYDADMADKTARYQVRKFEAGDFEGFARACGAFAANDAKRTVNATVMANAGRDRSEGVRFARVATGVETCSFCLMLASRGAVYLTRETAGEFNHFHLHCDCKVVPGFEDDPGAMLVEGCDPAEYYDRWKHPEKYEAGDAPRGKRSVGAVYSDVYAARDEEVAKADLGRLKQTQLVHIAGSKQSEKTAAERGMEPSCFTMSPEEVHALIKKHAGHGEPDSSGDCKWNRKENCTSDAIVGYVVVANGDRIPTRSFKIHYSNNGVHAVPRYDVGGEPDAVV